MWNGLLECFEERRGTQIREYSKTNQNIVQGSSDLLGRAGHYCSCCYLGVRFHFALRFLRDLGSVVDFFSGSVRVGNWVW